MDDNRVSPMEERALTNAIERAATVASINKDLDCNIVLANQLKKACVDPKFAKTASQAFNKRLTVLTFQKTADEHKADSFQLSDADTVYQLVAGGTVPVLAKAASFQIGLASLIEEPMKKAASAAAKPVMRYEHRVSMDTFQEHLDSMMDKYAAAFRDLSVVKSKLERTVEQEANDVATIFKNAHYDFDFTTAVNLYGDKLKEAIGDKLDKSASFVQTTKFVIKPQKQIFAKVAKLIEDKESLASITGFMEDYATALSEFCKSAAALSEEYQMKKHAAPGDPSSLAYAKEEVDRINQAYQDAIDRGMDSGAIPARTNAAADLILGGLAGTAESAIKGVNDVTGAARTALGNARALYSAGNNVSISPGDLLDAAFLTKDRYRDRLLAWSDMSADPQLALYPAEQVFQATNKAMDMDTSMERPDQRELLRAQVAQLLAQNNRMSTADVAALAATLKALSSSRGNAAMAGAEAVGKLSDKTAPEAPETKDIVGVYGKDTEGLHGLAESAKKDFDKQLDKLDKIRESKNDTKKDQIKELGKQLATAQGRVYTALSDKENREQKQLAMDNANKENEKNRNNLLALQNAADKAALGRERLRHLDYRAYLDEVAKQRAAGVKTTVEPPKREEEPKKAPEKEPAEGSDKKEPKKERKETDYDTPEKRQNWKERYDHKRDSMRADIQDAMAHGDMEEAERLQNDLDAMEHTVENTELMRRWEEDQKSK